MITPTYFKTTSFNMAVLAQFFALPSCATHEAATAPVEASKPRPASPKFLNTKLTGGIQRNRRHRVDGVPVQSDGAAQTATEGPAAQLGSYLTGRGLCGGEGFREERSLNAVDSLPGERGYLGNWVPDRIQMLKFHAILTSQLTI
ncbi:hypothetical protein BDZ97DRAFT_1764996 [Flammula alnicola]|nr:hypothetical protein BDZ97DRAFT_1764996 [Flammula alnicola]